MGTSPAEKSTCRKLEHDHKLGRSVAEVQNFTFQLQVWEKALPPCLAQSSAAFSFPVCERTCGLPQGWQSYIVFGERVPCQGCLTCEDSEVGYIPTGGTTQSLGALHVVIGRHRTRPHGRSWSGTEATTPC